MVVKKYKPSIGDNIVFDHKGKDETGTIIGVYDSHVLCSPNSIKFKYAGGAPMKCDAGVELGNIIGLNKKRKKG